MSNRSERGDTAELRERKRRLKGKVLTALIAIPFLILLFQVGGPLLLCLTVLVGLEGLLEFYRIVEKKGLKPFTLAGCLIGTGLICLVYWGVEEWTGLLFTGAVVSVFILQMCRKDLDQAIGNVATTFLGIGYVSWLLAYVISVRNCGLE